jgi:adenylate cyclase
MIISAGGATVPTLSLEILRVLTEADSILVRTDATGVAEVRLPDLLLATDPHGQIWVHFSGHDPGKFTSARDVLSGNVPPGRFQNKIILIGTSAIGLLDNKTTPIDRALPGVEIQAQLLESMLTGTTLVSPNDAIFVELLVAAAVSVGIILFAPILGPVGLLVFGAAVAALLAYSSWHRYAQSGILLDATFPLAASFLVYLTIVFTNYFREQLGRARIRSAFSQYLSPALVEQLAESPEKLRLGGEERQLTIMFSDVRGFTAIAEFYKHDPAGLTKLMNRFLTPLTNAILDRKGTIDKYMGDAIMAFWNAPLDDEEQEINAAQAALDMLARADALNAARKAEAESGGFPVLPLDVGIGINTGACVVGNMGSDLRFDYSVLGDAVNLASRLQGQSKYYGVQIVLGAATTAGVADTYPVLEIDLIRVKGKQEPERIFALIGDPGLRRSPRFSELAERHNAMIGAYRDRDWDAAVHLAAACRTLAEGLQIDGLYELYAARAAAFKAAPPPENWSGIYIAETK